MRSLKGKELMAWVLRRDMLILTRYFGSLFCYRKFLKKVKLESSSEVRGSSYPGKLGGSAGW